MFKLVISDDEGKTTVVPLVRDEITIGRKEGNTIRLTERNVSRRHARLRKLNGSFYIDDLGSYNGVKINGRRIEAESELKSGDQVTIGDYMIALQTESAEATAEPAAAPPPVAAPVAPARLVMLTPPTPGAEFSLRDGMRIGRAEDLDIWVNHRSISREHAVVRIEGELMKVVDLDSANGLRLNGEDVSEAILSSGDVVELGQVRFRYVARGEQYTFDVDRTVQMDAMPDAGPSRTPIIAAAAIVLIAIIAGAAIALSGGESSDPVEITRMDLPMEQSEANPAESDDPIARNRDNCLSSLQRSAWDDAIRAAQGVLGSLPNDPQALECLEEARAGKEAEEQFNKARREFARSEFDNAYFELNLVDEESDYHTTAEAAQILQGYVDFHLNAARTSEDAEDRARHATSVLACECASAGDQQAAEELIEQARQSGARVEVAASPRRRGGTNRNRSRNRTRQTAPTPQAPTMVSAPVMAAAPASANRSPSDVMRQCGVGNNRCLVRELSLLPHSPTRDSILIETYRTMGQGSTAERLMREFVQRYPTNNRATRYRRMLQAN